MFLLALIALCAVLTTLSSLVAAGSLWRTSHRLDRLMGSAHELLSRTNRFAGFIQNFFGRFGQTQRARTGNHRSARHVANKRRIG